MCCKAAWLRKHGAAETSVVLRNFSLCNLTVGIQMILDENGIPPSEFRTGKTKIFIRSPQTVCENREDQPAK
jgi:hypothetical protein